MTAQTIAPDIANPDALAAALLAASNDAARLLMLAGALDALHEACPATIHPEADELQTRALNGLPELIRLLGERAEALAGRLDRLHAAAHVAARAAARAL